MTTFNLRRLKLRSGEQFRDEQEIQLQPLELGFEAVLPAVAQVIFQHVKMVAAVAIVEDGLHQLARVEAIAPAAIPEREAALLAQHQGSGRRDRLGHRGDPEQGVPLDRQASREVATAVARRAGHTALSPHQGRDAGQGASVHVRSNGRVNGLVPGLTRQILYHYY
jgi:hypothetical protein